MVTAETARKLTPAVGAGRSVPPWRAARGLAVLILTLFAADVAAADLFEGLSKGERAIIEKRRAAATRSLRDLSRLEAVLTTQEMLQGDCKQAVVIDGKAKGGNADAQWILGRMHQDGLCVPKDPQTGARWLEAAAQQGHDDAARLLALAQGKNSTSAYRWMRRAAELGNAEAMIAVATMLVDGTGAPVNPPEGAEWLEKAAELREIGANVRLAWLHLSGKLGAVDAAKALKWGRPAAERGHPAGQLFSGIAAARSNKLVEAHKWLNLAASSDIPEIAKMAASERATVEKTMKPGDLVQARAQASKWKPVSADDAILAPDPVGTKQPAYALANASKLSAAAAKAELVRIGVGIDKDAYFDAARADNVGLFALFHRAGASLDERLWPMGQTPLYVAADYGSQKVFDYLLRNKADVNVPDDETGMTPLVRAIGHNRLKMAQALLAAGASARQIAGYSPESSGHLLAGGTPLQYALLRKDAEPGLVRALLAAGASAKEVYSQGQTTLMEAAEANPLVFRLLIEQGADPNAIDRFGSTVLHKIVASKQVSVENLREAVRAGARVSDWTGDRVTPLVAAVVRGHADAVAVLLAAGAAPDLPLRIGRDQTPMNWGERVRQISMNGGSSLMLASVLGHPAVAQVLVKAGADPQAQIVVDGKAVSALSIARESGNQGLLKAME